MTTTTNKIEERLHAEFTTFKIGYLNQVEEWAIKQQEYYQAISKEYYSISVKRPNRVLIKSQSPTFGNISYWSNDFSEMTEQEVALWNKKQELDLIMRNCKFPYDTKTERLVESQRNLASDWFDNSVKKLAVKIEEKGINAGTMSVLNTYVSQNLNTIITDGEKKIKAQTIFANGEIKRPHFRYLIK